MKRRKPRAYKSFNYKYYGHVKSVNIEPMDKKRNLHVFLCPPLRKTWLKSYLHASNKFGRKANWQPTISSSIHFNADWT